MLHHCVQEHNSSERNDLRRSDSVRAWVSDVSRLRNGARKTEKGSMPLMGPRR